MPELPEVETVRRTLRDRVVGRRIESVRVRERRLRVPVEADFDRRLTGATILDLRRVGKYLLFDLDDGAVWLVHLGMTGCLATTAAGLERHNHVAVDLSGGTTMVYNDPRRFGLMRVVRGPAPELAALGVDPLSPEFSPESLRGMARDRRRPIKNLLMDQRCIAGLGNIYASEILFRAGVRPGRRAGGLRRLELAAVHAATRVVLEEAIRLGGSSISDYRDGEGRSGHFQMHFNVYARDGEPCRRCDARIRARVLCGRSTFYCPTCQG
jgi:formamidopyrimidine-DNA glycosylase